MHFLPRFPRAALLPGAAILLALAGASWSAGVNASGTPATVRPPAAADGAQLFRQRCSACHSVAAGGASGIGPNLRSVVGRRSAAVAGFNYSAAMRGANVSWTAANLDRYLSGPARMVPGTRMVVSVPDATQRAAIVRYLGSNR